jgi:tRNA threonylcarbamoyladenosine biosynthesis protein TsaE
MSVIRAWKKVLESDLPNIVTELKEVVQPPCVIILDGPVGAGKTTFTRIFLEKDSAPSPTYSIINEVDNIVHADLFRIEKKDELIHLDELQRIVGDEFKFYHLKIEIVSESTRHFFLSKL